MPPSPHISHATAQGERSEQQDRYVIAEIAGPVSGTLLAVMDGHGGYVTAQIIAEQIQKIFESSLQANPESIEETLRDTVARLGRKTASETAGSTLSMVFIPGDRKSAYVAVLGDSPVLIQEAHGTLRIGPIHNIRSHAAERGAALKRGGKYVDGYLEDAQVPGVGLQMTRTLGDCRLARVLNREPEIDRVALGEGSWVLLATDGILSGADLDFEGQLMRVAEDIRRGDEAQALVESALRRKTGDNVSLILGKY